MRLATVRSKIIASAFAAVDRMSGDELLDYVNRPLLPSEERNTFGPVMTVRRYALARLDQLTA